jgi:hypothetical protein
MKARMWIPLLLASLALALALTLAGCSPAPATPEAALAVARRFMDARAAGDVGTVYGLLTDRARTAMPRSQAANFMRQQTVRYGGLGAPVAKGEGWVQVPVENLTLTSPDRQIRWPEALLSLHHNGRQWQVAWMEPLAAAAMSAYVNGTPSVELDLGRTIQEIDPYHYRGYLEIHFAYRELRRPREAEIWLTYAGERVTPYQVPDVEDAWARFKLSLDHPEDAIPHATAALTKAAPYMPGLYSPHWQADTLVVLAHAQLALGDRAGAAGTADKAAAIDPQNAQLAMFRLQLNAPPPAPAPAQPQNRPGG